MEKKMRITASKCLAIELAKTQVEEDLGEKVRFLGINIDTLDCGNFLNVDIMGHLLIIATGKRHEFWTNTHLVKDLEKNWRPQSLDVTVNMNGKSGPGVKLNMTYFTFDENWVKTPVPEPTEEELEIIKSTWS